MSKVLGEGGMSFVFLAEDLKLPRNVAVKLIRPELLNNKIVRKRIERECAMHATVGVHPNIITLHDKIVDNGNVFLIMEHVEGILLSEMLLIQRRDKRTIPFSTSVQIILQLLDALEIIHKHKIIHRDIKPSNIMIIPRLLGNSTLKLMDFGIARSESEDSDLTRLTALDSGGPGTPAYMAPERIDQKRFGDFSPATDLYSVGIIFFELLNTKPPFTGNMTDIFTGHVSRQPDIDLLTSVPKSIRNVLTIALEKQPTDRYQDANSFKTALKKSSKKIHITSDTDNILNPPDNEAEITLISTQKICQKSKQNDATLLKTKKIKISNEPQKIINNLPAAIFIITMVIIAIVIAATINTKKDITLALVETTDSKVAEADKTKETIQLIEVDQKKNNNLPARPPNDTEQNVTEEVTPTVREPADNDIYNPTSPATSLINAPVLFPIGNPFNTQIPVSTNSRQHEQQNISTTGSAEANVRQALRQGNKSSTDKSSPRPKKRDNVRKKQQFQLKDSGTRPASH